MLKAFNQNVRQAGTQEGRQVKKRGKHGDKWRQVKQEGRRAGRQVGQRKATWPRVSKQGAGEEASGDKCKSVSRAGRDKWRQVKQEGRQAGREV